jgi:hypothetical protein
MASLCNANAFARRQGSGARIEPDQFESVALEFETDRAA